MVQKGLSDREIIDYLVQRYGDFVLYRPPVKATTWLLWAGPFALLAVALSVLAARLRRRRDVAALSEKERAAARRLLGDDEGERA